MPIVTGGACRFQAAKWNGVQYDVTRNLRSWVWRLQLRSRNCVTVCLVVSSAAAILSHRISNSELCFLLSLFCYYAGIFPPKNADICLGGAEWFLNPQTCYGRYYFTFVTHWNRYPFLHNRFSSRGSFKGMRKTWLKRVMSSNYAESSEG